MDAAAHWHRIGPLRPRLRPGVRLHRHRYRGEVWHVLREPSSVSHHRLDRTTLRFIELMNGERSVQQCLDQAGRGEEAPDREEVLALLAALHAAGVLECDADPDVEAALRAHASQRRTRRLRQLASPLAVRVPLFDPDRLLTRMMPLARALFGHATLVLWLAAVGLALASTLAYWPELARSVSQQLHDPRALLIALVVYPVMKAVHELAHGLAVKSLGGAVHETGIMLLVLMPLPYVDASYSWSFADKRERMLVAAAGVMAELAMAAAGIGVWLNVEPGLVRDVALQVALIGGASTVLFNGNPLLRFDGYYVLADALEIPNLATRAQAYLRYLACRWLLGVRGIESPVAAPGESAWLLGYGAASGAYRVFLTLAIALLVAEMVPLLGVALAAWALAGQLIWPALKGLRYAVCDARTAPVRARATGVVTALVMVPAVLVTAVDVPAWTHAEGVVWPPEAGQLRTGTGGFVRRVHATDGTALRRGEPVIELHDPRLAHEADLLVERRRELELRRAALHMRDPVAAASVDDEIAALDAEQARLAERLDGLTVRSPVDGVLAMARDDDLQGVWIAQGELLGFVMDSNAPRAIVVVTQDEVARVRGATEAVHVRRVDAAAHTLQAHIHREVPAASQRLPSQVLGARGGGRIRVDGDDPQGTAAAEPVFRFELQLPREAAGVRTGTRVHARFEHPAEPLARQWERALRQLLLSRLGA